ncbi:LacI family DNA-binding transcriptional regulator [Xylanimonas allomyrinae]|uniref:LacI family DNA-binding transcriptional regulator n=2 Tax=Xylanimonas allomyrinae TaxID=2509459 RepID=A0A4P6EQ38_9MICO|nr:LacI family DNA-binding transcriptional regulator [Xylanimonas allomyrinae]
MKPPVIADVARVAGVSVPTVSRVLNRTAQVSPERRARVMEAVKELGFRPNGAARTLANRSGSIVAVFAGETARYGYATTIQGIEEAARQAGHLVAISVVETTAEGVVEQAIDHALAQPLAGAVVLEFDPAGTATLAKVPAWLPVVAASAVGESSTDTAHVLMDDRAAAGQATKYLLDLGHRTVHHVAIPSAWQESPRTAGWRNALIEAGAPVPPVIRCGWSPMEGYAAGERFASDPSVTAVLAGNDELAIGVIKGLVDHGRTVPGDVSVIGFDDHPLSQLWLPPLTTVRQDFLRLGKELVAMLMGQLESGVQAPSIRILPELVVRQSTGRPPG